MFHRERNYTTDASSGRVTKTHRKHELPLRNVCVDNFEIGKFEVTQEQWKAVMGANPSNYAACGDSCPVEQVSWNDAQEFLRRLNAKGQGKFRLPLVIEEVRGVDECSTLPGDRILNRLSLFLCN